MAVAQCLQALFLGLQRFAGAFGLAIILLIEAGEHGIGRMPGVFLAATDRAGLARYQRGA